MLPGSEDAALLGSKHSGRLQMRWPPTHKRWHNFNINVWQDPSLTSQLRSAQSEREALKDELTNKAVKKEHDMQTSWNA